MVHRPLRNAAPDTSTFEELTVDAPATTSVYDARSARFSADGHRLAAVNLAWRGVGSEVFFSGYSWGQSTTTVGRFSTTGELDLGELPFGSAPATIVIDSGAIDLGNSNLGAPLYLTAEQCPAGFSLPSNRPPRCSFRF